MFLDAPTVVVGLTTGAFKHSTQNRPRAALGTPAEPLLVEWFARENVVQ